MNKIIMRNQLVLVGKVKELKSEIKKMPLHRTVADHIRRGLN